MLILFSRRNRPAGIVLRHRKLVWGLSAVKAGVSSLFIITFVTSCAVGPSFQRPEAPETNEYTSTPLPDKTVSAPVLGGEAQCFAVGQEIPAQWWELFHSEPLDRVIREAMAASPTLSAAQAALRQAQENANAEEAALFPKVDANAEAERQKFSGASFGGTFGSTMFNFYKASLDASYFLDIFGGVRRSIEAQRARVEYQRYQMEGAYLALTSNIVTTVVKEASLRGQIRATEEIVASQEEQLEVVRRQFEIGGVSGADVLAQKTRLAQTRATLPPLEKELAQTRHQLAVLAGKLPGEAGGLPEFELEGLQLPRQLPVSLPSSLVRRRPDVAGSEALLHAANAAVGVAAANLYPQITLTGYYGSETSKLRDLFDSSTVIWSIAAELLQPIFHGGELTARRRAAIAAYEQAAAQYREIVLLAFQNVADVLRALELDAFALEAQAAAETAARDTLDLTKKQFQLGAVSYLTLLNAQDQYQQTRISLVQTQAARFADTAALFQALGGGWWNRGREEEGAEAAGTNIVDREVQVR